MIQPNKDEIAKAQATQLKLNWCNFMQQVKQVFEQQPEVVAVLGEDVEQAMRRALKDCDAPVIVQKPL